MSRSTASVAPSIALALLLLGPAVAPAEPLEVVMYGDSLLGGCDPCVSFPSEWEIHDFAYPGAEVWSRGGCDDASGPDRCTNGEDVVLGWGESRACDAGDGRGDRCIAAHSDADVAVLQWGTNDVRKACWEFVSDPTCDTAVGVRRDVFETAWENVLDALGETAVACVIAIPPPVWSDSELSDGSALGYATINARLIDVRGMLEKIAARNGCIVADLFRAFQAVGSSEGQEELLALYQDCQAAGGVNGTTASDCVHYSMKGRLLVGKILRDAIEIAAKLRSSPHVH